MAYKPNPSTGIGNNCGNCACREGSFFREECVICRDVEKETKEPFNNWKKRENNENQP